MHAEEKIESVDKVTLVDHEGRSYREFRAGLTPRYGVVWRDIVAGYLMVGTGLAAAILAHRTSTVAGLAVMPFAAVWLGYWFAYLNLFTHEAAHHNLAPDRRLNDLLADGLLCILFGMSIAEYRRVHWDHHRLHGTTADTENSYFNALTPTYLLRILLGVEAVKVMRYRRQRLHRDHQSSRGAMNGVLGGTMLVHGLITGGLAWSGGWPAALAWAAGLTMFYPFFNAVRQLLEHRDENADPRTDYRAVTHGRINRLFGDSLLAQTLGGAGFNRHLLHHWEPSVSYTRLAELEDFLLRTPIGPMLEERRTTYLDTARRLCAAGRIGSRPARA